MRYQYSRLLADTHRDVAHWRGARGGLRVLSLPTCAGWLQRQANDDHYDFWPDLAIGSHLAPQHAQSATELASSSAPVTFIMQKDRQGAWFIDAWRGEAVSAARPQAANGPAGEPTMAVSRNNYQTARTKSSGISIDTALAQAPSPEHVDHNNQHGPTSFIIEIGNSLN